MLYCLLIKGNTSVVKSLLEGLKQYFIQAQPINIGEHLEEFLESKNSVSFEVDRRRRGLYFTQGNLAARSLFLGLNYESQ